MARSLSFSATFFPDHVLQGRENGGLTHNILGFTLRLPKYITQHQHGFLMVGVQLLHQRIASCPSRVVAVKQNKWSHVLSQKQ